ncbi:MAG TPA: 2-oxoacid:ferredoxin oxidoreductase subunit beta [bacterium]|nr:2-oxoacid:ferredoxin oxidoreductase subunit beta [bacterium]HPA57349.1 2-oxoacid:ferredoxin oxidoreductase subunit beta [bacterium]HQN72469.1 2-oxoacid:ferredoxin oxidoreductase subunit beta [bacterium]HQO91865.1 2-oxoacid:ferredoxin oxidoreductase subunit beta [bacterium]
MFDYSKYLRNEKLPHIWCPGCGHGIVMKSLLRAIDKTGWSKDEIVLVSGIGCASRLPGYVDCNTLHTAHGRALAFATGIKLAKPKMHVIVVSGDGDALAIGGNHFIHACRRNIDITLVVFNNGIYGMTGGQYSPTTADGDKTATSPYGNVEPHFDIVDLATGAGATFVARGTSYHVPQLDTYIHKGLMHKGFSVIDVTEACYTTHGRKNKKKYGSNLDMLKYQKDNAISIEKAGGMSEEELAGKIVTGVFCDKEKLEFTDKYQKIIDSVSGGAK